MSRKTFYAQFTETTATQTRRAMKKFFLGSIVGIISTSFTWIYIFRWSIVETITSALEEMLSMKHMMDRHKRMARTRQRPQDAAERR